MIAHCCDIPERERLRDLSDFRRVVTESGKGADDCSHTAPGDAVGFQVLPFQYFQYPGIRQAVRSSAGESQSPGHGGSLA